MNIYANAANVWQCWTVLINFYFFKLLTSLGVSIVTETFVLAVPFVLHVSKKIGSYRCFEWANTAIVANV